jgi:hypothetical protein
MGPVLYKEKIITTTEGNKRVREIRAEDPEIDAY